jgi:hypothetical protein
VAMSIGWLAYIQIWPIFARRADRRRTRKGRF